MHTDGPLLTEEAEKSQLIFLINKTLQKLELCSKTQEKVGLS